MKASRKFFMGITGAAFIALGIICSCYPIESLISLAWVIGLITLVSGISTLINWFKIRKYFYHSSSVFLSGVLQILFGIIFLRNDLPLAIILPIVFAFFLIFEGINVAVRSADYKQVGFKQWWVNLVLGILATLLGFASLGVPGVAVATFNVFLSIGLIMVGFVYIIALVYINRFDSFIKRPWIDEQ